MNRDILATAPEHVQEEFEKVWERNQILDRALQIAAESIAAALRGEKVKLPGKPTADAPAIEWHDYFIGRGVLALDV